MTPPEAALGRTDRGATAPPALEVRSVSLAFGGLQALDSVSLTVGVDECVAVIGPNGAGKSTLLNCLSGLYEVPPEAVLLAGVPSGGSRPSALAALGVKRTFQNVETFREMTVREVLLVGACHLARSSMAASVLLPRRAGQDRRRLAAAVLEAAELAGLSAHLEHRIHDLPYGSQKRVDVARALVGGACLLLLDEPAAGLSDEEIEDMRRLVEQLRGRGGLGLLLVEHHLDFMRQVADRVYVLEAGRVIASGSPDDVLARPEVIEAYIGVSTAPSGSGR